MSFFFFLMKHLEESTDQNKEHSSLYFCLSYFISYFVYFILCMYLCIMYVDIYLVNSIETVFYGVFQEELSVFSIVRLRSI